MVLRSSRPFLFLKRHRRFQNYEDIALLFVVLLNWMSSVDFRMSIFWNFTYLLLLFIIRILWRNWNFIHPFGFTYYLSEQIYTENEFFLLKYHFLWLFIFVYSSVFRIFWKSSILSIISLQYFFFYISANFTAQKDCLFLLIDTEKQNIAAWHCIMDEITAFPKWLLAFVLQ